jgi:hypothetical protein
MSKWTTHLNEQKLTKTSLKVNVVYGGPPNASNFSALTTWYAICEAERDSDVIKHQTLNGIYTWWFIKPGVLPISMVGQLDNG